ncbi:MAG TPA: DUF1064 domain-containing protein [Anaerohalosphaeraceae bacterium]|nr:DUF1064 domain-containing protein [Anaerohalosphaeraceae bacterium]
MTSKYGNIYTPYNGKTYRSKLEAQFAALLDTYLKLGVIREWHYEPTLHRFENTDSRGKRKDVDYLPDFLVIEPDGSRTWYECKGFITGRDVLKFDLFKSKIKDDKLVLVLANRLRPTKNISVHRLNKLRRILDRIWDNVGKEFRRLGIRI